MDASFKASEQSFCVNYSIMFDTEHKTSRTARACCCDESNHHCKVNLALVNLPLTGLSSHPGDRLSQWVIHGRRE